MRGAGRGGIVVLTPLHSALQGQPALNAGYICLTNLFWISTVVNEGTLIKRLLHVLERKIGISIVFKQLKN